MAAKEMYDYLTTVTPDYTGTLLVTPQDTLIEESGDTQIVHENDSNAINVIDLTSNKFFNVTLKWNLISEVDSGTIFDFYHDSAKANKKGRTFYWSHIDGHTYVARFMSALKRTYAAKTWIGGRTGIDEITLRIEGRKAD